MTTASVLPLNREVHFKKKSIDFIQSLKSSLGSSDSSVLEVLSWGQKDYRQFLEYKKDISAIEFSHLAKEFHFSLKAFKENRVDFNAIKNRFLGLSLEPPERFLIGKASRNFTLINLCTYLEKNFGSQFKQGLLNHLQLANHIYEKPLEKLNTVAYEEMYSFFRGHQMSSHHYKQMGSFLLKKIFFENQFGDSFKGLKGPREVYEYLLEDYLKKIEQNTFFKIVKMEPHSVLIQGMDNPEILELFKTNRLGSYERCLNRVGVLSAFLRTINLPDANVRHISCVHKGDEVCLFEVDLTKALFFHENF